MHRLNYFARGSIHGSHDAALNSSNPNYAIAENGVIGPGRYWNLLTHLVRRRIDPIESAVLVRHNPYAIFARCDPSLWACWRHRESRTNRIPGGIDSNKRWPFPTERNPNTAESRSQTGAGLSRDCNSRNNPVGRRINSGHSVGFRGRDPDSVVCD